MGNEWDMQDNGGLSHVFGRLVAYVRVEMCCSQATASGNNLQWQRCRCRKQFNKQQSEDTEQLGSSNI